MSVPDPVSAPLAGAPPSGASGVGLGYGIAIAVGILVLVSTIMLASYLCVRVKGGPRRRRHSSLPTTTAAAPDVAATATAVASAVGLERAAIEAFYPRLAYGPGGAGPSGPCPICLAEYEAGEVLRRAPDCGHCFHAACVDEWLRVSATCPLCRSSPVPSTASTPVATPLSELIPLAAHPR